MIGEVIKKPGEKGSGGGREAFAPGVAYVCSKAARIEMRNIASSDWQDAADEMVLTSELSDRVQKPYYHIVLSWHEHEQSTDDQMFAAADHMIKSLGLEEHQTVIGTHHDTKRKHIHILANTVNPITGLVWSKSQDRLKIEKACREIEINQGWSHDRGRFGFEVAADGQVKLTPNTEAWEAKKKDRQNGKRPKTSGDRKFEKGTGFETFEHGIPVPLKNKFATAVGDAIDWQGVHIALGEMGLTYYKSGSGARVGIVGSDEFAKASAFGSKFSISRLEKDFGPYKDPESTYVNDLKPDHEVTEKLLGSISKDDEKAIKASSFKMTLLRRTYTNIHVEANVATAIRFVDLSDAPPQITFKDGSTVVDHGAEISTSKSTTETRAAMIAMAKAKGWSSVSPTGSPSFVHEMALECARAGLPVHGVPDDVQVTADEILEGVEKARRRIEIEAEATAKAALEVASDRDAALVENDYERHQMASKEAEMAADAIAAIRDLGSGRHPLQAAIRTVAKDVIAENKSKLPDRRSVSKPLKVKDADRQDESGVRRIASQLRENDRSEIEDMKSLDIGVIASIGGWADETRNHHDGHSDKSGANFRTYTKDTDTIKCSFKDGRWLWTSNKNVIGGSTIDLWLYDNPGKSLGNARKAFRDVLGADAAYIPVPARKQEPEGPRDHTAARRRWEEAPYIKDQQTYAHDRGISRQTLARFHDQVRLGAFGGVYFAHRHPETGGIQGFEQRWEKNGKANTARFARGGRKTASVLGDPHEAKRMVIFEGGLDALALAEIEGRDDTIYVSTGGGYGQHTVDALRRLASGKDVFSGFDNDKAGEAMNEKLISFIPMATRLAPPSRIEDVADRCSDWLDVLNAKRSLPAAPPAAPLDWAVEGDVFSGPAQKDQTAGQSSVDCDTPGLD